MKYLVHFDKAFFIFWYILTRRFLITYEIDKDTVIQLIKEYNVKNVHTKFKLRLWSRFDAINVLVDS